MNRTCFFWSSVFSECHLSEGRLIALDVFTQLQFEMNESKSSLVSTPQKLPKAREEMELLGVMSDCLKVSPSGALTWLKGIRLLF